jgi:hypothetical protein
MNQDILDDMAELEQENRALRARNLRLSTVIRDAVDLFEEDECSGVDCEKVKAARLLLKNSLVAGA